MRLGKSHFKLSPFSIPYVSQHWTALIHLLQSLQLPAIFIKFGHSHPIFSCYFLYAIHISFPWYSSDTSSLSLCFHNLPWLPILTHMDHNFSFESSYYREFSIPCSISSCVSSYSLIAFHLSQHYLVKFLPSGGQLFHLHSIREDNSPIPCIKIISFYIIFYMVLQQTLMPSFGAINVALLQYTACKIPWIFFLFINLNWNQFDEKLRNLQENGEVNIEDFSIATEIHEAAFKALGQWEENKRKDQEWWYDELKALESRKRKFLWKWLCNRTKGRVQREKKRIKK